MPIFDQGYQHWQGHLAGHGWRWLAVARHGVRAGMQNRFIRLVILFAWMPALGLAGVICLWGLVEQKSEWAVSLLSGFPPLQGLLSDPTAFRLTAWSLCFHYFIQVEMFFVMVLVLMVGPSLISQDLRFNALPLYFSRPVRRLDYFLGKLGVIGAFLFMVAVVPAVAAWMLGVLFSLDVRVLFDTARILFGVIVYGLVVTLSAGLLMLALSSLSRNSRYVGAFWAGLWILTNVVAGILEGIHLNTVLRQSAYAEEEAWRKIREEENQDARNPNLRPDERARRARERQMVRERQMHERRQRTGHDLAAAFQNDWRPCVSYTANLLRIGDALLGYYTAEDRLHDLLAGGRRGGPAAGGPGWDDDGRPESGITSPRWPWYWSGLVLVALGGLSVWILNMRVKDLDRLR
jgi:hypothetical protein